MSMTHYMSLLASNQPWNLIIFHGHPSDLRGDADDFGIFHYF